MTRRQIPVPIKPAMAKYLAGSIVADQDKRLMSEDMVEVSLPTGFFIHAGWYRQGPSGNGEYRIFVDCGLQNFVPPISTQDPYEAANEVAALAMRYSDHGLRETMAESCPTESTQTRPVHITINRQPQQVAKVSFWRRLFPGLAQ